MDLTVKTISIYDLEPDMILAENLIVNSLILVAEGTILTISMVKRIIEICPFNTIHVYETQEEINVPNLSNSRERKLIQTENIINRFSNKMDTFLDTLENKLEADITLIKNMTKEILDDLTDYGCILKCISNSSTIDSYLTRHCVNVALLSSMLGTWLNLSKDDLNLLTTTAFLSDIGKTKVDPVILNKPSKLSDTEFIEIKNHSIYAYELIKNIPSLEPAVISGVLSHHERLDGSGYPQGLKEDKISSFAKIIAITDMFEAMTSERSYCKKKHPLAVLEFMQHECIGLLDYSYLTIFIKNMLNYYTGEMVKLNNGCVGNIVKIEIDAISKPLISIQSNFIDLNKEKDLFILDFVY